MQTLMTPNEAEAAVVGPLLVVGPEDADDARRLSRSLAGLVPGAVRFSRVTETRDILADGAFQAVVVLGDPEASIVAATVEQLRNSSESVGVLVAAPRARHSDLALVAGAHEVVSSSEPDAVLDGVRRALLRHRYTAINTAVDIDPLTGLMSRSRVLSALDDAFRRCDGRPAGVGMIYVDIDHFKSINDTFGHAAGDTLLAAVGERMRSAVGDGAVRAGRLGGDEFVVIVEGRRVESLAIGVAARIREALAAPFDLEGEQIRVQVSMGVATDDGAEHPRSALRRADAALYRSKRDGRNRTSVFEHAVGDLPGGLSDRLADALDADELSLRSNLRVCMTHGHVTARCYTPYWSDGDLSSTELEANAAELALMLPLNRWTMRNAIAATAQNRGRCSVRLSGGLLATQGLVDWIDAQLAAFGVEAVRLELLVDEAELSLEPLVLDNLAALSERGVRLGIDQFGSTVGSLGYLARARVDTIVLAAGLVEGCATDRARAAIIQGVTLTAQSLGATIVAPRQSDRADRDVLVRSGCDEQQLPRHPALVAMALRQQRPSVDRASSGSAGGPQYSGGVLVLP